MDFLDTHNLKAAQVADARKERIDEKAALSLARQMTEIYNCKGSKYTYLNLRDNKPSDKELAENIMGPTGNLRAPSLRVDSTLLVGFNEEVYNKVLNSIAAK